jgi:hypothetical protein
MEEPNRAARGVQAMWAVQCSGEQCRGSLTERDKPGRYGMDIQQQVVAVIGVGLIPFSRAFITRVVQVGCARNQPRRKNMQLDFRHYQ